MLMRLTTTVKDDVNQPQQQAMSLRCCERPLQTLPAGEVGRDWQKEKRMERGLGRELQPGARNRVRWPACLPACCLPACP